ncbi:MAG: 2-C-methyl-D-erythritol 4-phosphate cytidylyltransferase [Planctomycetota bacterium]
MKDVAVILAAAGQSSRFRDPHFKKVFITVNSKPVWQYSAQVAAEHPRVAQIILTIAQEDKEMVQEKFTGNLTMLGVEIVIGGKERHHSVRNALERLRSDVKLVAIHDAARPCLTKMLLNQVIEAADKHGAAILASPIRSTVKRANAQLQVAETVSREGLWQAQTPQVFRVDWIQKAYANAKGNPPYDSQVAEMAGYPVAIVEAPESNMKITTKEDLRTVEALLKTPQRSSGNPFF